MFVYEVPPFPGGQYNTPTHTERERKGRKTRISFVVSPVEEEVLELVHPDLGHPDVVEVDSLVLDLVRGEGPEDVTDPGARGDLDAAAAHPGLEGDLEVLASPNLHP